MRKKIDLYCYASNDLRTMDLSLSVLIIFDESHVSKNDPGMQWRSTKSADFPLNLDRVVRCAISITTQSSMKISQNYLNTDTAPFHGCFLKVRKFH